MSRPAATSGREPPDDRPFLLAWEDIVLRAKLSHTTKLVALAMKHHANADGTSVRPSTVRLCVLCDLAYATVKRARQDLLGAGLVELVRRGNRRRGHADEYRLILAEDLDDRLQWLSPNEVTAAAEKIANARQCAEAARIHKRDQGSHATPEDQGSHTDPDPDQGSHTTRETRFRAHRRSGSGLTDDPPPSQGDQANGDDQSLLGSSPHQAPANDPQPTSPTVDNPPACSACGALLDPGSTVCFVCRTRAAS